MPCEHESCRGAIVAANGSEAALEEEASRSPSTACCSADDVDVDSDDDDDAFHRLDAALPRASSDSCHER